MASEDKVTPDGTWTGAEERVRDTPLIRTTDSAAKRTLRQADEVVRSLGRGRR